MKLNTFEKARKMEIEVPKKPWIIVCIKELKKCCSLRWSCTFNNLKDENLEVSYTGQILLSYLRITMNTVHTNIAIIMLMN